jgi:Pentapeptide repeats (8 copies)
MADQEEPDLFKQREEGLDSLRRGVDAWNQWRKEHPDTMPFLFEANLDTSNLSGIDFRGAYLVGAHFKVANLRGANLSGAHLSRADLWGADLSGADLTGADLSGATLIRTNLSRAILIGCSVYGTSAWGVQLEGARQENLLVTDYGEPAITVDNLEVAQFIYLLLNHKKLRDVLNSVTKRGVLILGRFGGGGLDVLQAIAAKLRAENYLPIIFDFERPQDRNYTETVKTLAGLARFVIADLSGPSVPQELYATVPHFKIPFVPIIEAGRKPFAMAVDILEYPWVVRPPVTFATIEDLLEQLPAKVITPAEEKHQARQKLLDELFNRT